jgi:DNA polymerase-3 subunit delta'
MMLADIIGQPKALRLLNRALASGRLAHGYLFSGPDGVGKATTARIIAKMLLCRQAAPGEAACGHCPGCGKFESGNHPDFLHVKPAGAAIKIDQIRELKKALIYSPLESNTRVIVIEDIHTMRREAGNSLLKLLEEPPAGNLLILLADDSEQLLPTIVSRCQVIPFYALPVKAAAEVLCRRDPRLDPVEAEALAGLSGGCPGRALAMDTDGVMEARHRVVDEVLGAPPFGPQSIEKALLMAGEVAALGDRLESFLDLLWIFFKDVMIDFARGESGPESAGEIVTARQRWNLAELSAMVRAVEYARRALGANCNRTLVCETLFLKLLGAGD